MASDLYVKACDSGRSFFQQLDNLSSHIASKSKITACREHYLLDSALVRSNVQDSVHFALTEMFKINDQNSPDKKLWASEVIWQSWLYIAKIEGRPDSCLRVVGQYFVTNEETKQIIWESLKHSAATREGPVRGHVEYSPLHNGFYALLGSPNGKTMMRMLSDHKSHIGYKTVEQIVLVGDDELVLSEPEARTFLVVLSNKRQPPSNIPKPQRI